MNTFLYYFLIFILYTFIGWIGEVILTLFTEKKFINRGFLIGPACPIYGFGAIIMTLYLTQYKDDLFMVFTMGAVICSILEYITSYLMEKIFKARWWDYSRFKFNINGRICLYFSCLFGLGGVILIYVTNPIILPFLNSLPNIVINITSIILLILFLIDVIISFNIINKVKSTAEVVSKDYTEEVNKKVNEVLKNKFFQFRILKAFPKFNFNLPNKKK